MRLNDRNYLIALALFGNGGSHKAAKDSGRILLVDAVAARLKEWGVNPSTAIKRTLEYERLASMSLSFSTGVRVISRVRHPDEFPQPTKPTKATAELLQRYDSRLKGWESMVANAKRDVEFIQSLAATLGFTEVPQFVDEDDEYDEIIEDAKDVEGDVVVDEPTLESVVGKSLATMLIEHFEPRLNTIQSVKDAVANGFDLTDVDGIGPKKASQIKALIGL